MVNYSIKPSSINTFIAINQTQFTTESNTVTVKQSTNRNFSNKKIY